MVDGHDDYPIMSEYTVMQNSLANIGITNVFKSSSYSEHAVNRDEAIDRMRYSKAVFVNGHGSQTSVNMHNTHITSSTIGLILNDDGGAFDMCDLVVYVSCLTASGGTGANNLCQATLDAGVNTVIGFTESIPMTGDRYWMKKFVDHLTDKWGQTAYSYINISDLAMADVRDWNSDIMEYDYVDPDNNVTHVKMDSCVVFGQQNIPTANAWN